MLDRRAGSAVILVTIGVLAFVSGLDAAPRAKSRGGGARPEGAQGVASIDNLRRIDVNRINMYVTNYGSFAWDLTTGNPGLLFPKGTDKAAVFAAGMWLGARVGGLTRTVVSEYSQEFGPGNMVGGTFSNAGIADFHTYKVVRYSGDKSDTAHVERDADDATYEDPLVHHSWSEYIRGAAPYGAPTRMYRLPVTEPAVTGDSVDVLGPDVLGDMMLWSVYNDANPSRHTNDAGGSPPLGVEVQQTTFAFNRQGALGNIVFLKYTIINKGANQLDSMFVSLWSDTDLGGAADDLVGVDTTLSLGYTYNATNNDQLYGSAPPAVGYDFFLGPKNSLGVPLPMTSFNKYVNGTDPHSSTDTYNYMNGILPNGNPVIDPTTGAPTKFFHPGDPTTLSGWLDSSPADRRHLLTSGPFRMAVGDTQTVVGAIVIGDGNDRLSSISAMKFYDGSAQVAFDRGFVLANPPAQPKVVADVDHERITLTWDAESRNNYTEPGYRFEGYNVYQGQSVSGPWKRLGTFDEVNGVLTVRDTIFDLTTGREISDYPVAFGTDAGLAFSFTTDQDAWRGGRIHDATEYFFAVTAYAVGDASQADAVVENAQQVVRVVPQRPAAGTDPSTASATDVEYTQISTSLQPTTDRPIVAVMLPESLKVATYKIGFTPVNPLFSGQVGQDTATVLSAWSLIRTSLDGQARSDTLLRDQLNRRGDQDYEVVDGIQVRFAWPEGFEKGSYFPVLLRGAPVDNAARSINPGPNWSGNLDYWVGAAGYGKDFKVDSTLGAPWGSTLDPAANPAAFDRVELQFGATSPQNGYRFLRYELGDTSSLGLPGDEPPGGRRYTYGGFVPVPLQAMDVLRGRQLDFAFVERILVDSTGTIMPDSMQVATFDSTYRPLGGGSLEYAFVIGREYDGTAAPAIATDGAIASGTLPLMYALWAGQRGSRDLEDSSPFTFDWVVPATPNDEFTFSTTALVRDNRTLAKSQLERIRAVPNPYYNRSRYELNQFARIIRFVNMPERATVRIFTLSGGKIRTLEKTDPTSSILEWDLLTENQLPVASGIYIFHVESPGGSMFGRLVVFMEKERLNNF